MTLMSASYLRLVLQSLLATAAVQGKLSCPSLLCRGTPSARCSVGRVHGYPPRLGLLHLRTAAKTLLCETVPLLQQHQKQSLFRNASIKFKSRNYAKDQENHSKSSNSDFFFNNMIFRDAWVIADTTQLLVAVLLSLQDSKYSDI